MLLGTYRLPPAVGAYNIRKPQGYKISFCTDNCFIYGSENSLFYLDIQVSWIHTKKLNFNCWNYIKIKWVPVVTSADDF